MAQEDLYDCADFQYQEDAQAVHDQDISDLYRLDGLPGEAYAGKVWPAKDCHKEGLHPELLIPGAGIPTTLCTTASSLVLKDPKDGNVYHFHGPGPFKDLQALKTGASAIPPTRVRSLLRSLEASLRAVGKRHSHRLARNRGRGGALVGVGLYGDSEGVSNPGVPYARCPRFGKHRDATVPRRWGTNLYPKMGRCGGPQSRLAGLSECR